MLKNQLHFKKIYLVTGRTDLRNGIQGLAALVRLKFGKNPLEEETLFLFCGNDRKTVKGLVWDSTGYVLITKKLSYGHFQLLKISQLVRQLLAHPVTEQINSLSSAMPEVALPPLAR